MDLNYNQAKIAGFPTRLAAFYLNLLILLLITYFISKSILGGSNGSINIPLFLVIFLPLSFFSDIFIQSITGYNLGKLLLGLKIVDDNNFKSIGIFRNILRSIVYSFALLVLGIGLLAIPFNPKKKGLHDLLSNTVVIYNPESKIPHSIHKAISYIAIPFAFIASILIPVSIIAVSYNSLKFLLNNPKNPTIVSVTLDRQPRTTITLPSKSGEIVAQVRFNQTANLAFTIDPQSNQSYINEKYLKNIKAKLQDAPFYISKENRNLQLQRRILIPEVVLKNTKAQDLELTNVHFLISNNKNIIGKNILNLFNYSLEEGSLRLKLYPEDIAIIESKDSSAQIKKYMRYAIQQIRDSWEESTLVFPKEIFDEVASSKKPISNEIEIEVETKLGYVLSGKLLKPSKNEKFNDFCTSFIHNLPRFKNIPPELKSKETFTITYKLVYDGHLRQQQG